MCQDSLTRAKQRLRWALRAAVSASVVFAPLVPGLAQAADAETTTPIKHVIIIIGENHTYDNIYATYKPVAGQTVSNLLSKGIVNADGTPGPHFARAAQYSATVTGDFSIAPADKTPYSVLPPAMTDGVPTAASDANGPPFVSIAVAAKAENALSPVDLPLLTTGASGIASHSVDTRYPDAQTMANGPFPITNAKIPYDSYTPSPVHRFYQMWQQLDCSVSHATADNPSGCLSDLFPWVEVTIGAGSNGKAQPANFTDRSTGEGNTAMGFFNISAGDAPYFKDLADRYTSSDNFHQSVQGGTGANHIVLGTGLAMYYSDDQGNPATPPANEIEDPRPQAGTNNYYSQDGYSGGSYSNCSDPAQPGVKPILDYLSSLPYKPNPHCEKGAYYLLNNYNPGYLGDGTVNTATFTIPPSTMPTIADELSNRSISWRYYGAGWDAYVKDPSSPLYCNICNPFQYSKSVMTQADQRQEHMKDIPDLDSDIKSGTLPAVSYVKPDGLTDGHPASSKLNLFEAFTRRIVDEVQANPALWASTAILITMDEGGGSWDSGYVQPLDFFGDGTRIPAIMVSAYSKGGRVSHVYGDHVSFLKFVERNWGLKPVSADSRDNLPNPQALSGNPYVPVNSPAIGDLTDLFDFTAAP
ncbi:MAG: alkaline phosphatase family protein [Azospirillaceae bacterium]|nr:alkaline phosphatase family protein [Azospirillaceae bacterium]